MKEKDNVFEWLDKKATLELTNENVADIMYAITIAKINATAKHHWNTYKSLETIRVKIERQWKDYEL